MKTVYEYGTTAIELSKVTAIRLCGSCIEIYSAQAVIIITPEFKDSDGPDLTFDDLCKREYRSLLKLWKIAIGVEV